MFQLGDKVAFNIGDAVMVCDAIDANPYQVTARLSGGTAQWVFSQKDGSVINSKVGPLMLRLATVDDAVQFYQNLLGTVA